MPTTATTIEGELLEVTGAKKKRKNESEQKFRDRLARSVNELEDDDWNNLGETAQEWANEAADAIKNDQEVPEFPDAEDAEAEEEEDEPEDEDEEEEEEEDDDESEEEEEEEEEAPKVTTKTKSKKKAGRKKASKTGTKKATSKKVTKKAPKKARKDKVTEDKPRKWGAGRRLRELCIENPKWSLEKLIAAVEKENFSIAEATAKWAMDSTSETLEILAEMKRLKPAK